MRGVLSLLNSIAPILLAMTDAGPRQTVRHGDRVAADGKRAAARPRVGRGGSGGEPEGDPPPLLRPCRTRAALETMRDGMVVADREGHIMDVNPAAEGAPGKRRDEVLARAPAEVLPALATPPVDWAKNPERAAVGRLTNGKTIRAADATSPCAADVPRLPRPYALATDTVLITLAPVEMPDNRLERPTTWMARAASRASVGRREHRAGTGRACEWPNQSGPPSHRCTHGWTACMTVGASCAHRGCATILSVYHPSRYCVIHSAHGAGIPPRGELGVVVAPLSESGGPNDAA